MAFETYQETEQKEPGPGTALEKMLSKHDGELQQIRRELSIIETYQPTEEEDRALTTYDHFKHLVNTTNHTPITRMDSDQELARLKKIAWDSLNAKEQRVERRNKLLITQQNLESKLVDDLRRANYLIETIKPKLDVEVGSLDREIKQYRYVIDRDTKFLLSQIAEIETLIEALEEKLKIKPKQGLFNKTKTIDDATAIVEIEKLKREKQGVLNKFSQNTKWCAGIEEQVQELERQKNIKLNDYNESMGHVKGSIFQISGIILED